MRASQGKQPREQQAQLARSSRERYGHRRSAVARAWGAMLLTVALTGLSGGVLANVDPSAAGNVKQIAIIEPGLPNNAHSAPTSAQDLSLFGVLALGIIGLLWVRRHTSEL